MGNAVFPGLPLLRGRHRGSETLVLVGTDPRAYEMLFWEMSRRAIAEPLGVRAKAIAGVELALLDIKAKALGILVVELFGGPRGRKYSLDWSHCGTTRALYPEMGKPPIRTMRDIADLGKEVVRRGYTALKTNIVFPGDPARVHFDGFGGGLGRAESTDQVASTRMLKHIETLMILPGGGRPRGRYPPRPELQLQARELHADRQDPGAL